ncbi:MAG: mannose-1-phosphate guanylyltransferase [Candidatus Firestonebacteria bacterium]|nr:mannose-1-phosphate guanylyltransferase [Candidatus Firestonebacteria bacterium]
MYAVIMAGGSGKRFWPRSRENLPKQLISVIGKKTMLQETVERLKGLISSENIFIVTNYKHAPVVKNQLTFIPDKNIIIEPMGKNTAPCIGLASIIIERIDKEAAICVLPSDHLITDKIEFQKTLKFAAQIATEKNCLITIGASPTKPETGYGYIKFKAEGRRQKVEGKNKINSEYYEVDKFVEKPNLKKAKYFLQTGNYLWNSGMFVWTVKKILAETETYLPELHKGLTFIKKYLGTKNEKQIIKKVYSKLENISIDYGIMEKAKNIIVIRGNFGWNDLGSWSALYDCTNKNKDLNVISGNHIGIDSKGLVVWSPDKLVATIGIDDAIIVETQDAILICKRNRSQDIKNLTDLMIHKGLKKYL